MIDVARQAVEAARAAGATYADARVVSEEGRVAHRPQPGDGGHRPLASPRASAIRVLVDGYWGSPPPPAPRTAEIARTAALAVEIARAAVAPPDGPDRGWPRSSRSTAAWSTPMQEDPFTVAARREGRAADGGQRAACSRSKGVTFAEATHRLLPAPHVLRLERGRGDRADRSSTPAAASRPPRSATARCSAARSRTRSAATSGPRATSTSARSAWSRRPSASGSEAVDAAGGAGLPERDRPRWSSTRARSVLQVHESIGHPVELDRVLGMEEAYAGTSFVTPERPREAAVRQPADHRRGRRDHAGGLGTFGFDDEGVAGAAGPADRGRHVPELPSRAARPPPSSGERVERRDARRRLAEPAADPHDEHQPRARRGHARRDHRRHRRRHLHGHEPVVVDRRQARELPVRLRDRVADQRRPAAPSCTATRTTRASRPSSGDRATRSAAARSGRCGARRTAARASRGRSRASATRASPARFRDVQVGVR